MKNTIEKWKPILEALNVSENNYEFFATYAENFDTTLINVEDQQNLLPINLKTLSQLDFNNINITFKQTPDYIKTVEFTTKINKSDVLNVAVIESKLVEELSTFLNTKKEIIIYKLVSQIGLRDIDENNVEVFLQSRVSAI